MEMTDTRAAEELLAELQHGRLQKLWRATTRLAELQRSIGEAAAWCTRFLDRDAIGTSLRPSELTPSTLPRNRWAAVDEVVTQRASGVRYLGLRREGARGRLLVYFPDADLCDGAAQAESHEFFDVHNAPPWGTWIGYFEDGGEDPSYTTYLLAWVPEALIGEAEAGISVNPEACIVWLDQASVRLRPLAGLLDRTGGDD